MLLFHYSYLSVVHLLVECFERHFLFGIVYVDVRILVSVYVFLAVIYIHCSNLRSLHQLLVFYAIVSRALRLSKALLAYPVSCLVLLTLKPNTRKRPLR
jgi:hypothetical protein